MTPPRSIRHPVRVAHLGLGAFHRAHQAWFTQVANDAGANETGDGWGIAAFTGRRPDAARILAAQDSVYSLVTRGPSDDNVTIVEALSRVHDGADDAAWLATLADPQVAVLTLTVTEAGYLPGASAPGRVRDGLAARFRADAGGLAVVSCDNLSGNGRVLREAVLALTADDADLDAWVRSEVSFVSTMVDRITPATTEQDLVTVRALAGWDDAAPVITEPFSEWVLAGSFPAGRPVWEAGGARFVDDVEPFERRKLRLLNAGHSLLAYHGLLRGRQTIAEAAADPRLAAELKQLWAEQRPGLPFDDAAVAAAEETLRERFANARIEHRLAQVATDGSQKLGPRIVEPLRERLAAGLEPGEAQLGVLAAWTLHLLSGDARDPQAEALADRLRDAHDPLSRASLVLDALAPDLTDLARPLSERTVSLQGAPA
ncbi:mannitol dehydrogenase family protein [Leifsonia poae]|uniref:mannitol dehydrogenase family protein n=1 Tax=Leifsonia poae TaxID=110933 RepID=UPI003D69A87D